MNIFLIERKKDKKKNRLQNFKNKIKKSFVKKKIFFFVEFCSYNKLVSRWMNRSSGEFKKKMLYEAEVKEEIFS